MTFLRRHGQPDAVLLRAEDVRKTYGRYEALGGVSFEVLRGESVGLVGESGAGKSTIANIIIGLIRASSGSVSFAGEDWSVPARHARARRRRASSAQMVFQSPSESFSRTKAVLTTVADSVRLYHPELDRLSAGKRAAELFESVGLPADVYGPMLPARLSGGQLQRVAIARALAANPQLLVLDEPVAALDVSVQAQIIQLLNTLRQRQGTSYLLIAHDIAVVRELADRVIVLNGGRVVEEGETDSVILNPQHAYTKLLIESIPSPAWRARA